MNEGLALRQLPSPNNVPFASRTQVNQSNTNSGIALGGCRDGPCLSCMNFMGVRTCNYDSFNWKQALFEEMIPKKFGFKK